MFWAKKVLSWPDLIATGDLFTDAFSLELNTHGSGSSYNNTSKLTLLQPTPIAVDKIEFNYGLFDKNPENWLSGELFEEIEK
ncbi:MAG: hypothetical protein PVI26_11840 [Chitinispirillia bacterium]|jgi:hypothetical protein